MNYQPRGISTLQGPASYQNEVEAAQALLKDQPTWNGVSAEAVARMRLQNRFKTGLDIARYTAGASCARDMAAYDADPDQVHPVAGLLARLHRPAEADLDQEALRRHDRSHATCTCPAG